MDSTKAEELRQEWLRNEAEIERLASLPVGVEDPAERQRRLDARQDEIEYLLARDERRQT